MQDLKFSQCSCWRFKASGKWCCVNGWVVPEVSQVYNVFIIRVMKSFERKHEGTMILQNVGQYSSSNIISQPQTHESSNFVNNITTSPPPNTIFWTMWIWDRQNRIHTELQSEVIWTNTWQCCSSLCTVAMRCAFSTYRSFTRMSARARRSNCGKMKHLITSNTHNNLGTYWIFLTSVYFT